MAQFDTTTPMRATRLRDATGSISVLQTDVAIQSTTVYVACAGLAPALDGYAVYVLDGYIAYQSSAAGGIAFTFDVPPETYGLWDLHPVEQTVGAVEGSLEVIRRDIQPGSGFSAQGAAGSGTSMMALVTGFVHNRGFPGALQLKCTQITSTGSTTVIRAGSWLRLIRVDAF